VTKLRQLLLKYKAQHASSCVLVPVTGALREKVLGLAKSVPADLLAGDGRETDPHITLLAGIERSGVDPVANLLSEFNRPVSFVLGAVSVFENDDHDVLKVEVKSLDLHTLHHFLRSHLPNTQTHQHYSPHCTLAYVRKGEGRRLAAYMDRVDLVGRADEVIFSDTDRKHATIKLGKEPAKYEAEKPTFTKKTYWDLGNGYSSVHHWSPATVDGQLVWSRKKVENVPTVDRKEFHRDAQPLERFMPDYPRLSRTQSWKAARPLTPEETEEVYGHVMKAGETDWRPQETIPEDFYAMQTDDTPVKYAKAGLYTWSVDPSGDPEKPHRMTIIRRRNQTGWPLFSSLHATPEEAQEEGQKTVDRLSKMATLIDRLKQKKGKAPEPKESYSMQTEVPVRYEETVELQAHPTVAGFQLEHFLRHLTGDQTLSPAGRESAQKALTEGHPGALWELSDELHDTDHPMAGKYRLLQAASDLSLDRATGEAIRTVAGSDDHSDHQLAVQHLMQANYDVGDPSARAVEAVNILKGQKLDSEDLHRSLERHKQRLARGDRHDSYLNRQDALSIQRDDPERYQQDMGDYDPLPTPSDKTAPIPQKQTPRQRLMAAIAQVKARQAKKKWDGNYDYDPLPKQPEKYRQSPALSDFIQAVRQVRSSNQQVRREIATAQWKKLKLDTEAIRDAISDAPHTASADTASSILHDGDLDRVRAGAALIGLQTNSPSLLLFHESDDGIDLLHRFTVNGSAEKLRKRMDAAGLVNRTLIPTETGWSTLLYDPSGAMRDRVEAFAQSEGTQLETSRGQGEMLGGGDEAEGEESSRKSFRSVIRQWENQQRARIQQTAPAVQHPVANQYPGPAPAATGQPAPARSPVVTGPATGYTTGY
jgi:2'-5' RNA ligase